MSKIVSDTGLKLDVVEAQTRLIKEVRNQLPKYAAYVVAKTHQYSEWLNGPTIKKCWRLYDEGKVELVQGRIGSYRYLFCIPRQEAVERLAYFYPPKMD